MCTKENCKNGASIAKKKSLTTTIFAILLWFGLVWFVWSMFPGREVEGRGTGRRRVKGDGEEELNCAVKDGGMGARAAPGSKARCRGLEAQPRVPSIPRGIVTQPTPHAPGWFCDSVVLVRLRVLGSCGCPTRRMHSGGQQLGKRVA